jgi:hypothetical protein
MANLPYIESINIPRPHLSLYHWVKEDPEKRISILYSEANKDKMPRALYKRALRFRNWFESYPGDGVLYFHDDLLSELAEISPRNSYYKPDEYNKFFNYLYSFRSGFTAKSKGVLAFLLLDCPYLAVPLYNHRKKFNPGAFTKLINKFKIDSFQEYIESDNNKLISQFLWHPILGRLPPLSVCDDEVLLDLYFGYTHTALKRFFLMSTARCGIKEHIDNAFNIYKETCLLLHCWGQRGVNRQVPQMSSVKAMKRFHDIKTEEMIEEQRKLDTHEYTWDELEKVIKGVSQKWYLPKRGSDIRLRGQQHHNCVGGYVERHFKTVSEKFKMILIFTDDCEAEIYLTFEEVTEDGKTYKGCINAEIMQAKTAFNKDITPDKLSELHEVIKAFKKLPLEFFNPVSRIIGE